MTYTLYNIPHKTKQNDRQVKVYICIRGEGFSVRIPAGTRTILTEVFRGFTQSPR
jgi:hypothetical protein